MGARGRGKNVVNYFAGGSGDVGGLGDKGKKAHLKVHIKVFFGKTICFEIEEIYVKVTCQNEFETPKLFVK